MRFGLIVAFLIAPAVAFAGDDGTQPLQPLDPVRVVTPISILQGDGVKVGEGTSIYPQVGVEAGYVSNVFYTSSNPIDAGLFRFIAEIGAGSLSPQRRQETAVADDTSDQTNDEALTDLSNQGAFQYSANLYATWDQYLSSNKDVTAQGGLGAGAYLRAVVHPGQPVSLLGVETFDRILRAENFETPRDTNRDINTLVLQLNWRPAGRTLGGALIYSNTIDVFENDQFQVSNRLQNRLALRVGWRVFPVTEVYGQVSEGYFTGLGSSSQKVTSYPLNAVVGINTALTANTALVGRIGYAQGFYSSGPDYASVDGGLYLDWRYSPLGRFRILYDYQHTDSINANFYRDHVFQAWLEQRVKPVSLFLSPELRLREYDGVLGATTPMQEVRNDVIVAVSAGFRFQVRDWLIGTAEYRLVSDQTDYRYTMQPDPSYVRHEILAGVRAAY